MADWDSLWIEAGEMSGGSRNQVEFDQDLASFFASDLPAIGSRNDLMIDAGKSWLECSFAAKKTSFGVLIYRLSLPTVARGGRDYQGQVLRFTRSGPSGSRYFRVDVVPDGSPEHLGWRESSAGNGTLGRSAGPGGREFGYL